MHFRLEKGPTFGELCDASAVAPLDDLHFFAASDEATSGGKNRLARFHIGRAAPVARLELNAFLRGNGAAFDAAHPETDLESATRVGDTIFWIGSHGRNERGQFRANRQRFFAIEAKNGVWKTVGNPYTALLTDLKRAIPEILAAEAQKLAPENGGVSIEGLCAGPEGSLLLGFRSPRLEKRALGVALLNPFEVISGQSARLGAPFTLDLGTRGIRDWLALDAKTYLIVAGSSRSRGTFALFLWNGHPASTPRELGEIDAAARHSGFDHFHPEAILQMPNGHLYLMSDDGDCLIKGLINKRLPTQKRSFRSARLYLEL